VESEVNCLELCGEPEFSTDKDASIVLDRLDEVAKVAGNMFSVVDRCLVDSLESPVPQFLSGEIGISNNVWQGDTVGVGGKSSPEAELFADNADANADVVDGGEFGIFCAHLVFSLCREISYFGL
jgi:hypothetical protein